MQLRPLIIVTGTVHVEGGFTKKVRSSSGEPGEVESAVVEDRKIDPDRRAANVIATNYMRKLRAISILRTPFGVLCDSEALDKLKLLIMNVAKDVSEFNRTHSNCHATNTILWEHLRNNRLDAVRGWVSVRLKDPKVKKVLPRLVEE